MGGLAASVRQRGGGRWSGRRRAAARAAPSPRCSTLRASSQRAPRLALRPAHPAAAARRRWRAGARPTRGRRPQASPPRRCCRRHWSRGRCRSPLCVFVRGRRKKPGPKFSAQLAWAVSQCCRLSRSLGQRATRPQTCAATPLPAPHRHSLHFPLRLQRAPTRANSLPAPHTHPRAHPRAVPSALAARAPLAPPLPTAAPPRDGGAGRGAGR